MEVMVAKKTVEVMVPRMVAANTTAVASSVVSLLPAGYIVRVLWVFVMSVT